jgi:hypothetical protein
MRDADDDLHVLHADEVDKERKTIMAFGLVALVVLAVAVLVTYGQLTASGPADDKTWPAGIAISAERLTLGAAEQEDFDRMLLGSEGDLPRIAHLPPIVPGSNVQPWYSTEGLNRSGALQEMSRCMSQSDCTPPKLEDIAKRALQEVGVASVSEEHPAADAPGSPCQYEPRGASSANQQVPAGLLAIVMASIQDQDCKGRAIDLFHRFHDLVTHNTALTQEQKAVGQLYADFQLAKLNDGKDNAPRFQSDMDKFVDGLLKRPTLATAYASLKEDGPHGLSMAEILAESMLAHAREAAREVGPAKLGAKMAGMQLPDQRKMFEEDPKLQPPRTPTSSGHAYLQLAWCLLTLRAGPDAHVPPESAGGSEVCLQTLQQADLPQSLACGVKIRLDLRNGIWNLTRCDTGNGVDSQSSRSYMRGLAQSPGIWRDAFRSYQSFPPGDKRDKLSKYLSAYAGPSGPLNAFTWLAHEHPDRLALWLILCLLDIALAFYLVWALPRYREIIRMLSPPLELD